MHHRDVDPDLVLGKPAGSRRRAATQSPPPMPSLPTVVKVPQVPLALSYAEELAQPVNDVVDHSLRLSRALQGGFTPMTPIIGP